jgi:hypothetical protein
MNHNILRSDDFIVALNNSGIHFINRCERAVTIIDDVSVPVMLISSEKECWGRVHVFSGEARYTIGLEMLFLSAPQANNDVTSRLTDLDSHDF